MNRQNRNDGYEDGGFTLIEVLVTVLILGLLAGIAVPVVIQQIDGTDPTVVSSDLNNLQTSIEAFKLDLRPDNPEDVEDLAQKVANATDTPLEGGTFDVEDWDGPYTDIRTTATTSDAVVASTGFDGDIRNGFVIEGSPGFVTVRITGLTEEEFAEVDSVMDGNNGSTTGSLLFRPPGGTNAISSASTTFFLAMPTKG